jgi:hypothetical protein
MPVTVNGRRPAPTSAAVLAHVLAGRTREFTCRRCGCRFALLVMLSPMGRPPAMCERCEPRSQTWVREREVRPLRALVVQLYRELRAARAAAAGEARAARQAVAAELQQAREEAAAAVAVAHVPVSARRAARLGAPGPDVLRESVMRVARAPGRGELREALLDVAAVAQEWARKLGP